MARAVQKIVVSLSMTRAWAPFERAYVPTGASFGFALSGSRFAPATGAATEAAAKEPP
jgi:hypothetical protein